MLNTLRLIYHQYIYKGLLQMVSGFIFCLNPVNFQKKLNLYVNFCNKYDVLHVKNLTKTG